MLIDANGLCLREQIEAREDLMLAPEAARSIYSRGRQRPELPCPFRTDFQRDRDRILHSKSFRRLAGKTQVFVSPRNDHDRTRLTHSLEVCQVARTVARVLRLNEDLTEAIALGHDLGHSAFGHAGETALNLIYQEYDPDAHFHHAEQSLRMVDLLERDGRGLNLTWEVRNGIAHHSKGEKDWPQKSSWRAATLEGQLVALADRIAYSSHDIDDAMRAGLLTLDQFPAFIVNSLGTTHSARLTAMIGDIINASRDLFFIRMTPEMTEITNELKNFMYLNLYLSRSMAPRVRRSVDETITGLFRHYMDHPTEADISPDNDTRARARLVCDFIAGMTDDYARDAWRGVKRKTR